MLIKEIKKIIRKRRVRAKISGTAERPRLSVYFSNKHIVAQLIDDTKGQVLAYETDAKIKKTGNNLEIAREVGKAIAKDALNKKIDKVVFDKGSKKYHGKVKALADGAREAGLNF